MKYNVQWTQKTYSEAEVEWDDVLAWLKELPEELLGFDLNNLNDPDRISCVELYAEWYLSSRVEGQYGDIEELDVRRLRSNEVE